MSIVHSLVIEAPVIYEDALYAAWLHHDYQGLIEEDLPAGKRWTIFFRPEQGAEHLVSCRNSCVTLAPQDIQARLQTQPVQDWSNQWKEFFKPVPIAPGIVITADGIPCEVAPHERLLTIVVGMAFGTGQHPTTQLIARAVAHDYSQRQWSQLLDVGTGSGILGLVALACGVPQVAGVDNDPDALIVARENIDKNQYNGQFLLSESLGDFTGHYPAIVANILLAPLCDLAPLLLQRLAPAGDIYFSGILTEQIAPLSEVYVQQGLHVVRSETQGEWAMLHCRRPT